MFQQSFSRGASLSKSVCVRAFFAATFALFICFTASQAIRANTLTVDGRQSAPLSMDSLQNQMELVKADMEKSITNSRLLQNQYSVLANTINDCSLTKIFTHPEVISLFSPAASLCINGAVSTADPDFNRPLVSSTGTGIGNGTPGNCSLSGTATAANYDVYNFNLTGCNTFPTVVTAQLCGPAGCAPPQGLDSVLFLYRNVPAGDPLTANGGLPNVFNPASPCTNARAGNDDSGATPTSTGGSTCNQLNNADCLPQCGTSTALSEFKRTLGSERFTLVVAGFGNTTVGNYNLYVDAPGAGCTVALVLPTAASVSISGRVTAPQQLGLSNALVTLTASNGESRTVRTGRFGAYRFTNVAAGETYILTVSSKRFTYTPQVITVNEEMTEVNFMPQ